MQVKNIISEKNYDSTNYIKYGRNKDRMGSNPQQ